ncbi:hypothetical protein [Aneurinibacillus migulanus]|jgi:hypothetical protein|uniref:Uncharacterized protein n=2 Tax=Aneurinibacillus migulanus TaxID=47500 RepID=A0A1G9BJE9_ANEMI|nr:hypothetical protein [Aneurinibacillus migulanus]KIV50662.1 hypothetical protein TS65_29680 [Aneurinibacillus migulanus]MED0896145.1 hypothetical protein [Aneurinibacillus migulanus]MED1618573.1 hypothetical protein [Aneurinibacillus migulanus]MED4730830.1 hypothetical protein [Aneurinibacillus migulanus]SDK38985.1 hypothetical protein SAMN04487909_15220 [Aneurinibacillus migulanus]
MHKTGHPLRRMAGFFCAIVLIPLRFDTNKEVYRIRMDSKDGKGTVDNKDMVDNKGDRNNREDTVLDVAADVVVDNIDAPLPLRKLPALLQMMTLAYKNPSFSLFIGITTHILVYARRSKTAWAHGEKVYFFVPKPLFQLFYQGC